MRMRRGKEVYDSIIIPNELSARVADAIAAADKNRAADGSPLAERAHFVNRKNKNAGSRLLFFVKSAGTLAAALLICLTFGVNTSQVFAEELSGLPVIGGLVRVLTVRSYEGQKDGINLQAQVPGITAEPAADYAAEINTEIEKTVDDFITKARLDMEDYKEAFLATGGTEEQWAVRMMDINVDYEVKYQSGSYLSLVLHATEGWIAAYREDTYYNLDLSNHKSLTLQDLLGDDYAVICNAQITAEIERQVKENEEVMYFGFGDTADDLSSLKFETVTQDTPFYINEAGNPVVCFEKYEIAPGYMGVCEFEILQNR